MSTIKSRKILLTHLINSIQRGSFLESTQGPRPSRLKVSSPYRISIHNKLCKNAKGNSTNSTKCKGRWMSRPPTLEADQATTWMAPTISSTWAWCLINSKWLFWRSSRNNKCTCSRKAASVAEDPTLSRIVTLGQATPIQRTLIICRKGACRRCIEALLLKIPTADRCPDFVPRLLSECLFGTKTAYKTTWVRPSAPSGPIIVTM